MFVLFKKEKSNRITIRLMIYAISLTGFISFHAWGEFYPVIVSIKTRIESATTATYFFQQGVANIGPISEQIMLPEGWYIALAHRHDGFPGGEDIVVPAVYMQGKKRSIGRPPEISTINKEVESLKFIIPARGMVANVLDTSE